MSAMDPPLQERVYAGLKADYLAGHFVPGKRIDLQDLANRHRSSKTPVREAAFILVGEGLLTHHADGGFLVPVLAPTDTIELLEWHMQLMLTTISALKETVVRSVLSQYSSKGTVLSAVEVANRTMEFFTSMASAIGNREASAQVRLVNERLHYIRIANYENPILAEKELAALTSLNVKDVQKATRRRVETYHLRKILHQRMIIQETEPGES